MHTASVLIRLHEHQSRILRLIDAALPLLAQEPSLARGGLAKARWTLLRLLREYQLFKHGEVFGPAIRYGAPRQAATAQRMRAACIAAGDLFTAHVARWSAQDIAACWPDYKGATRAMCDGLRLHIARERREVQELLAGTSDTRRQAEGRRATVI